MGYTKSHEYTVVKTKHIVEFREGIHSGTSAYDLIEYLKHVPKYAKIIDVDADDKSGSVKVKITFYEEKEKK